ncbi:LAQU0S17e02630g1_1 [Lachancea quebecensis]|uniref:LAQU0S17e02630g1_1 n=1 Tax=Lachancea quebecensis TaxID=1654605 RepID=A0A0N7MMB0_9SACH|nr:LAQU0S17e02630g1_1 [Lachancea quebecensis]
MRTKQPYGEAMEHQRPTKVQKRNRPSFVCQDCRRRKIKCDKKRPRCNRCVDAGLPCTYLTPGSRSAMELQISEDEAGVWTSDSRTTIECRTPGDSGVALSEAQSEAPGEEQSAIPHLHDRCRCSCGNCCGRSTAPGHVGDSGMSASTSASKHQVYVNFGNPEDTMVGHEQLRYLHKPFSALAMMQHDHFLRAFAGSVTGVLFTDMHSAPANGNVEEQDYSDKLNAPQDANNKGKNLQEVPVHVFMEEIKKANMLMNRRRSGNDLIKSVLFQDTWSFEDSVGSTSAYPPELVSLVAKIQDVLPEAVALRFMLEYFYEVVYPLHPFLDVPSFEKVLDEVLKPRNDRSRRYDIILGTNALHNKLENLTILLVVLKISYAALNMQHDSLKSAVAKKLDIFGQNSIKDDVIPLAHKCLNLLSFLRLPNENTLCCLLFLWIYQSYDMDDVYFSLPPHVALVLGTLSHLSVILGLHNDPSIYPRLIESSHFRKSLLNYRRKLWLGIVSVRTNELLLNGSSLESTYSLMASFMKRGREYKESYMSSVIQDEEDDNIFDTPLHELIYKEYELRRKWAKLNAACNSLEKPVLLSEIEKFICRAEDTLMQLFPLTDITEIPSASSIERGTIKCAESKVEIDYNAIRACKTYANNLRGRIIILNICMALTVHFENLCRNEPDRYLEHYQKYLELTFRRSLEIVKLLKKLPDSMDKNFLFSRYKYALTRITLDSVLRTLIPMCSILFKLSFAECQLKKSIESESVLYERGGHSDSSYRLQMIVKIKESLAQALRSVISFQSKNWGLGFLSCYRIVCMAKYVLHLVDVEKLPEVTNRFWEYQLNGKQVPETIANRIFLKWGLKVKESKVIKDDLLNPNVLGAFNSDLLESFRTTLERLELWKLTEDTPDIENIPHLGSPYETLPEQMTENAQTSSPDVLDYFKVFEDEYSGESFPGIF